MSRFRCRNLIEALPGWQLVLHEGDTAHVLALSAPAAPEAPLALVQFVAEALRNT